MDRAIKIVGIGPGAPDYLLPVAHQAVAEATTVVGGARALALFDLNGKEQMEISADLDGLIAYLQEKRKQGSVVVLVSGDPGFYSLLGFLRRHFSGEELEVIPGISSIQMAFARWKIPWQDAVLLSLHGRDNHQLIQRVKDNQLVAILTDLNHTPARIASTLLEHQVPNRPVFIGSALSYPLEKVVETDLHGATTMNDFTAAVMIIGDPATNLVTPENPVTWEGKNPWAAGTPGIPDSNFRRGKVPMTKEEIRAITMAKARLPRNAVVYDIGSGTGSLSIEAALLAPWGHVYAIERRDEGVNLIEANIKHFGVKNITVIHGQAPEAMRPLPYAHCIIVGGSGGSLEEILHLGHDKLISGGRMVVNAITLETLEKSVRLMEEMQMEEVDVVSVSIAKIEKLGNSHMFRGQNPIYIISATKRRG